MNPAFLLLGLWSCFTNVLATTSSGTVVVASGNTLKVHTTPSTGSPTLYSFNNGAVVTLVCQTKGDTISGS